MRHPARALARLLPAALLLLFPGYASPRETAPLFYDPFQRTTGLGPQWSVSYGSYATDGAYAVSGTPPVNGNWAVVVPELGTSEHSVSAEMILPAGSQFSGVVARSSDPSFFDRTLYAAQLASDGTVNLYRRNDWAWTLLSSVNAGITAGTRYSVKLTTTGDSPVHLEVWLDGTQTISIDDASSARVTKGRAGLQNYSSNVRYTNFTIEPMPRNVFADYFARTSGLGSQWYVHSGSYSTDGTYAISGVPPSSGNWARVVPDLGTTEYAVSANIVIPPSSKYSGIAARSSDASSFSRNLYAAQLASDGKVNLYRRNDWTWTLLSSVDAGIAAGTSYSLMLVATGSSPVHLEVWVDGTRKIDHDDSSPGRITQGRAGIQNYNSGVKYTNFVVGALSPSPTGADVAWTNQVNTTTAATTIRKTTGVTGVEDAGATSKQSIASGNAVLSIKIDEVSRNKGYVGLSRSPAWQGSQNIDFAFSIDRATASIKERGVDRGTLPTLSVNDVLTVEVADGVAQYYRNGTLHFTSAATPVYPLFAAASMVDVDATLSSAKLYAYAAPLAGDKVTVTVAPYGNCVARVTSSPPGIDCPGTCSMTVPRDSPPIQLNVAETDSCLLLQWDGYPWCPGGLANPQPCSVGTFGDFVISPVLAEYQYNVAMWNPIKFPCGRNQCGGGRFPIEIWRPYGLSHTKPGGILFNRTVRQSARRMSNSDAIISYMLGPMSKLKQVANMTAPKSGHGGWPTYWGTSSDPRWKVTCAGQYGSNCSVNGSFVHAPAGATAQGNDEGFGDPDLHMTLIDQTDQKEYDLWHVRTSPLLPSASMEISTEWSGHTYIHEYGGVANGPGEGNAARIGNLAGRVRVEELRDAVANRSLINHALAITVNCTNGKFVYPATGANSRTCSSIGLSNENAPPLGARIRLTMTMDEINTLPAAVPEWKRVFLRTLAIYGAIIMDTGSSFYFNWHLESGNQYTSVGAVDQWLEFGNSQLGKGWYSDEAEGFKGLWRNTDDGIDWTTRVWNRLEVLEACGNDATC